jgi:hypothetical protein
VATRRPRAQLIALGAALVGLTACGGGFSARELAAAPAWFKAKQKEVGARDYPDLAAIPDPTVAADQSQHWNRVEKELLDAQGEIRAEPRAQPAPPQDAEAFENEARGAVDNARPK